MLNCLQLEELEALLLEVPALADSYRTRDADFADRVMDWLILAEKALQQNQLPAAGTLASLRASIISAERGVIPEQTRVHGLITKRKVRQATAIDALKNAVATIDRIIEPDQARQREAREMMQRMVALAIAKKLSGFCCKEEMISDSARWSALQADPDTRGGVVQLEGLVGRKDSLILLSRSTTRALAEISETSNQG